MKNTVGRIVRQDCFACNPVGACTVLSEALCQTRGRCPFFKTKEQVTRDRERTRQSAIAAGYYAGGDRYTPKNYGEGGPNA